MTKLVKRTGEYPYDMAAKSHETLTSKGRVKSDGVGGGVARVGA